MTGAATSTTPLGYGLRPLRPQYAVRRSTLVAAILQLMAWLALFRATGMWPGYPSTQQENALVEPATQQALLYSLIPLIGLYAMLEPVRTLAALTRVPLIMAAIGALLVASTLLSQDLEASVRGLSAVVVISIPMLLFKEHCGSAATYRLLRRFAAAAVLLNLAYTAVFPGTGVMSGSLAGAMRGLFLHKNLFGQFSAIAFVLLLPQLSSLRRLRWSTLYFGGTALLALASVALSKSSTGFVLVTVGAGTLMFVALMRRLPGTALRGYAYVVSITAVAVGGFLVGNIVAETIADAFGKDLTFSGRTEVWEALVPAIFEHPWVGHGFALFRQTEYIQAYTSHIPWGPRSTHNSYIELALNAGLPAALLWVGFLLTSLAAKAVRVARNSGLVNVRMREVAIMLMVTLGSMTEAGLVFAPLVTWVLLLAALGSPEDRPTRRRR